MTWERNRRIGAAAVFALLVGVPSLAQETPRGPEKSPRAERDGSSPNVRLEELEIQGEIERPKIFFILPKAEREAAGRERQIRFYPDILEPIDRDRFEEEARVLYQHGIPAE